MMPVTANQVRDAFERHRENHGMLVMLMRRVTRSMDDAQMVQFEGEFEEVAGAIARLAQTVQELIDASIQSGALAEQRSGAERRRPYDRRWHTP